MSEPTDRTAWLRSIFDGASAVVYVKDTQGRYLFANRQFETLFSVPLDQLVGKTDLDLFPRELAELYRANDRSVLETRMAAQLEEVAAHPDGLRTYLSFKFPLHDSEGRPYAVCGISCDITERKRAEEVQRENIRVLETLHAEQRQRARQLTALVRAGMSLTRELSLEEVLQTFVDVAREVLGGEAVVWACSTSPGWASPSSS